MVSGHLLKITAGSIELGPINFDLLISDRFDSIDLLCKAGFEVRQKHLAALEETDKVLYIRSTDLDKYADYAYMRLETIIRNPEIRVQDKAEVLHTVGKRSVKQLLSEPTSTEVHLQSESVIEHYVDFILDSPEASNHIFALSALDAYTYSHSINVAALNIILGNALFKENREQAMKLGLAGLLHDLGKVKVDETIIFKKGALTEEEYQSVKKHSYFGYKILKDHSYDDQVIDAAYHHHERIDGKGYPHGLCRHEIELFARITAITDVFDAITSQRVYKDAAPVYHALKVMAWDTGHFDELVFNALVQIVLHNERLIEQFWQEAKTANSIGDLRSGSEYAL